MVYDLALSFWHKAKETDAIVDVAAALSYAAQILGADPEAHLLSAHPEIWGSDDEGLFLKRPLDGRPWSWRHPLAVQSLEMNPAIIHAPQSKGQSVLE